MELKEIINILEENFPKEAAYFDDFIGLQVEGKKKIRRILIALDLTLEVINETIIKKIDLIIVHHPLIFGNKADLIAKNNLLKAKISLLEKMQINVFVIHTNADFNSDSIAYNQALVLEMDDIEQIHQNKGVIGNFQKNLNFSEFFDYLENALELKNKLRTNIYNDNLKVKKIIIGSGAAGELIYDQQYDDRIFIIGEVKYHQWIYANDNNIKLIEIGHHSEKIFKQIVFYYLKSSKETKEISIFMAEEAEPYKVL